MNIRRVITAGTAALILSAGAAQAQVTVHALDLAGFNAAAGNLSIMVDFDSILPGTNIGGSTLASLTFNQLGSPLQVVRASDTYTPVGIFGNVIDESTNTLPATSGLNILSPGGIRLDNDFANQLDSAEFVLSSPASSFGFDILWQSRDGLTFGVDIQVYDTMDMLLYSGAVPMGGGFFSGPGGSDFWGITSTSANIKRIVVDDTDNDSNFPDANIGYDTFRFGGQQAVALTPELPAGVQAIPVLLAVGGMALYKRRKQLA